MMKIILLQIIFVFVSMTVTKALISELCTAPGSIVVPPGETLTEDNVLFALITPTKGFQNVNVNNIKSLIDPTLPVWGLVPGYAEGMATPWINTTASLIAQKKNANVIVVNYIAFAPGFQYYFFCFKNINVITKASINIFHATGATQFYMVGHSFGCHVIGLVGQTLTVMMIVALDPAGPCFDGDDVGKRLDIGDAKELSVIHTNQGIMGSTLLGETNFYPNGGVLQPSCPAMTINDPVAYLLSFVTNPKIAAGDTVFCSHRVSCLLFVESLMNASPVFCGQETTEISPLPLFPNKNDCKKSTDVGCNKFGLDVRMPTNGIPAKYYFKTNNKSPFCTPQCAT